MAIAQLKTGGRIKEDAQSNIDRLRSETSSAGKEILRSIAATPIRAVEGALGTPGSLLSLPINAVSYLAGTPTYEEIQKTIELPETVSQFREKTRNLTGNTFEPEGDISPLYHSAVTNIASGLVTGVPWRAALNATVGSNIGEFFGKKLGLGNIGESALGALGSIIGGGVGGVKRLETQARNALLDKNPQKYNQIILAINKAHDASEKIGKSIKKVLPKDAGTLAMFYDLLSRSFGSIPTSLAVIAPQVIKKGEFYKTLLQNSREAQKYYGNVWKNALLGKEHEIDKYLRLTNSALEKENKKISNLPKARLKSGGLVSQTNADIKQ